MDDQTIHRQSHMHKLPSISVCHLDLATWRHYDFKQLSYFKLVRSDGTETLWDSYENGLNSIAKQGETIVAGCASGIVELNIS